MSFDPIPYDKSAALVHFLIVFGSSMLLAVLFCFLLDFLSRICSGIYQYFSGEGAFLTKVKKIPFFNAIKFTFSSAGEALYSILLAIGDFFVQMIHLSCRRIWSLCVLTIRVTPSENSVCLYYLRSPVHVCRLVPLGNGRQT